MKEEVSNGQKKRLSVKGYPDMVVGFSTQDFQSAMPVDVESLAEIIEYASKEGYQFIELRDDSALLKADECRVLAEVASDHDIDVIYEIHKNPLDPGYEEVFARGLSNTLLFPSPGILRTLVSKSEFDADTSKKGWTKGELDALIRASEDSAYEAKSKNVRFIVENFNEPFFGDGSSYYGLSDFFDNTVLTGLQFDISNPFRSTSRKKADPEEVAKYLLNLKDRWVTTHFKTALDGEAQPVVTDNPLTVEEVTILMGKMNVMYFTLELMGVKDKQQCYDNHASSILFLMKKGILKID